MQDLVNGRETMPRVPVDGRRQFSGLDALMGSVLSGRLPYQGFQRIAPNSFVLAGSYPMAQPQSPWDGGGSVTETPAESKARGAAEALWPDLK
jgi:hypothetical protein